MNTKNSISNSESPVNDIQIGQIVHAWAQHKNLKSIYHANLPSTNDLAKTNSFSEDELENEFTLYLTDNQTAGRGRQDHTWTTPAIGSSLLSSWSYQIEKTPKPYVTALCGLAFYNAAKATWPFLEWSLKAPNDIYLAEKKVAGLLVETVSQGAEYRLIIGLGFNVFSYPKSILTSTSLLESLPSHLPLLGEDYIAFIERLFFEFSNAVSLSNDELNTSVIESLIIALNQNPILKQKIETQKQLLEVLWR